MSDTEAKKPKDNLVVEYEIDAPPEMVWRAISIPELEKNGCLKKTWPMLSRSRQNRERKSAIGCAKKNRLSSKAL